MLSNINKFIEPTYSLLFFEDIRRISFLFLIVLEICEYSYKTLKTL